MSVSIPSRWTATFTLDGQPGISFPVHSFEIRQEADLSPGYRGSTGEMEIVLRRGADLAGLPNLEVSTRGQLNVRQGDLALRYPVVFRSVRIYNPIGRSPESETIQYNISFAIVSAFAPVVDSNFWRWPTTSTPNALEYLRSEDNRRMQEILDRQYLSLNLIPAANYYSIRPAEEEVPSLPVLSVRQIPKRRRNIRVPLAASLSE